MAALIGIDEAGGARPQPAPATGGGATWQLGFRPFYLAAAIFAALSVPVWSAQFAGWLPKPYLDAPVWHAHEMLFGFTLAVIAGFLLTAVRNWTGLPTPTGRALMALVALWVAGRILVLTPFALASAVVDAAFPLALAFAIGVPLVRSGNRRNLFFIALMIVFAVADAAIHASQAPEAWPALALPPWLGVRVALDAVLLILVVMSGRVVPMFTNNAVPHAGARRNAWIERVAIGGVLALIVADAAGLTGLALVVLLVVTAIAHVLRVLLWHPWRALRVPLVWVLHAACAWIPVHLVLRALADAFAWIPPSLATHALTIGAIGGLTIGMMTRTARGHTGRPLRADRFEVACYALVLVAAIVRVFGPIVQPAAYMGAVIVSASMWSAAYALYAIRYWPVLTRPRVDGRPG